MTFLNDLPVDHPDRNRPLVGMWYRWKYAKAWREIMPAFGIAKVTFNDLAPCWTDNDYFAVEKC